MNGINSRTSSRANKSHTTRNTHGHVQSVETAGSLAMNMNHNPFMGMLSTPLMDVFTSSTPFIVDYAQYAYTTSDMAMSSGFLSNFSSAVSTISSGCGSFSDGGTVSSGASSGGDCGGASVGGGSCGGGSCGGGGGFTSVC